MFVSIPIQDFDTTNVLFSDAVPNLIMKNSTFVKMLYATELCTTNGLYVLITMNNVEVRKFQDGTITRLIFQNTQMFERLEHIEASLLDQYQRMFDSESDKVKLLHKDGFVEIEKTPIMKLKEHLERKSIKLPNHIPEGHYSQMKLIVKLSGVWVTTTSYGITYKFIPVKNLLTS